MGGAWLGIVSCGHTCSVGLTRIRQVSFEMALGRYDAMMAEFGLCPVHPIFILEFSCDFFVLNVFFKLVDLQ
jgi:hypothetical protein